MKKKENEGGPTQAPSYNQVETKGKKGKKKGETGRACAAVHAGLKSGRETQGQRGGKRAGGEKGGGGAL